MELKLTTQQSQPLETIIFTNKKSCQPCKNLKSYLNEHHSDFKFTEVDVFEDMDEAMKYNVRSAPTIISIDSNGKEVDRVVGFNDSVIEKIEHVILKQLKY